MYYEHCLDEFGEHHVLEQAAQESSPLTCEPVLLAPDKVDRTFSDSRTGAKGYYNCIREGLFGSAATHSESNLGREHAVNQIFVKDSDSVTQQHDSEASQARAISQSFPSLNVFAVTDSRNP